jgi:hypothetical protein
VKTQVPLLEMKMKRKFSRKHTGKEHMLNPLSRGLGYMSTPRSNKLYQERLLHEKLNKIKA